MTKLQDVRTRLTEQGYPDIGEEGKPNGHTVLWVVEIDAVINVWETGTCTVQGKEAGRMEEVLAELVGKAKGNRRHAPQRVQQTSGGSSASAPASKRVFVVYGHDATAKDQLTGMLQR